jgi:predicted transcriptional regulator
MTTWRANPEEQPDAVPLHGSEVFPAVGDRGTADRTPVAEIMMMPVVCVEPHQSARALCAMFLEKGISGAPVVDQKGRPLGMVSKTDLIRWTCEAERNLDCTVSDVMVPVPVCVNAGETIARAAAIMAFERVHRVPIVDSSGCIVGIVSSIDVMGWLAREHGYVIDERFATRSG